MNTDIFEVEVEWLDGTRRTYTGGGYYSTDCLKAEAGQLHIMLGNSQYGPLEYVAVIPLDAVREWKRRPKVYGR